MRRPAHERDDDRIGSGTGSRALGRARSLPIRQVAALGLGLFAVGCASGPLAGPTPAPETPPTPPAPVADSGPEVRPEAPAEYDFLVGREHELAGRLDEALDAFERAAAKDPGSGYLQRKVGALAWRRGELDRALEHAERAHAIDPDDPAGRVFLGKIHRLRRQTERAEAVLTTEDGTPVNREAALLLYGLYADADRHDEALATARWLIDEDPDNLRAYFALARAYEALDRPDEAEAALRDALDQAPESLSVFAALARLYRERGDRDGEIAVYREVLLEYPHHRATLAALADAQIATSRTDDARATLEELVRHHPGDVRSAIRLALLEFEGGDHGSAAERFEQALADSPEDYEIAYFLGVLRQRMDQTDDALRAFERIPEHHGRYGDARAQIAALFERQEDFPRALEQARIALRVSPSRALELYVARLRAKTGDFDGAIAMLETRRLESPDDDELLYNIGVLYGEAKQYDEALRYMHMAIDANPENASALNYIGYTWAERGERLDEAEVLIERANALRPDDGYITDSLGWVYYMRALALEGSDPARRQLLDDALRTLHHAAELTGGDPVISEHLGDVYLKLDQKQKALERYREAMELDPREAEQPDLRRKLEDLERELLDLEPALLDLGPEAP